MVFFVTQWLIVYDCWQFQIFALPWPHMSKRKKKEVQTSTNPCDTGTRCVRLPQHNDADDYDNENSDAGDGNAEAGSLSEIRCLQWFDLHVILQNKRHLFVKCKC